ncbi:MAG: hypothetical protein ACP5RJ_06815 [Conexivisphaera sp.]
MANRRHRVVTYMNDTELKYLRSIALHMGIPESEVLRICFLMSVPQLDTIIKVFAAGG